MRVAKREFVFGYGSLIQAASRRRNLAVVDCYPARLSGWRRGWCVAGPEAGFSATFLGVGRDASAATNGVAIEVDPNEWAELDRRESGYRRVSLDHDDLTWLGPTPGLEPGETVAIYEALAPTPPTAQRPIIQSYVDICLEGCLEVDAALGGGEAFTREFLESTHGWNAEWVNDRLYPRAPFRHVPQAWRIDALLHERCPAEFDAIRLE